MGQVIFAAIDIETTGLDVEKHEIIDFAIVPLNDDFKVSALPEFSIRIKADHPENCGWPRKLDNLTWCKMPVKLT